MFWLFLQSPIRWVLRLKWGLLLWSFFRNEGLLIKWALAKNNSGNAYLVFRYMLVEIYPNMTVCRVRPKSCSDFFLQSPTFGSFTMHLNGVSIYWCYTYRRPNARQEFPIFDTILGPMVHFYEPNLFLSI